MVRPEPFRSYSAYLKDKYGEPVYRVAVDAGFSCPNRGPDRSSPGCSYCDEHGSRAPYLASAQGLRRQVEGAVSFLRHRYNARRYLLYFQAFSNTYAPPERLRKIYDSALELASFEELIVSTRPDCIDERIADLLGSYRSRGLEVWVELGLQSASNETLRRIKRGHSVEQFRSSYRLLRERRIKIAVHLIFGLPGEGWPQIRETVRFVAELEPEGVKIHNLHIPRGCPLYNELLAGELVVPCPERHLQYVVRTLELLPPRTVIMRLTCDTPDSRLASPRRFWPKARFYERVRAELRRVGSRQGKAWETPVI